MHEQWTKNTMRADPDLPPFLSRDLICKWITCGLMIWCVHCKLHCWHVQPSVCRTLRQWFFAMSNSWVAFSVWNAANKSFGTSEKCSETGCRPGHHDIELVLCPEPFHCVHLLFFGYQFLNISNPKLCLRTFVWKWGHTRHHGTGLICYVKPPESCFQFRIERADASHWIVCYTFFCLRCKRMDQMLHLQHHGTDLCLEAACGSWKACVPSGTECNWRKLICSTVRLERLFVTNMQNQYVRLERLFVTNMQAKPVANCCLSVKFFFSIL